MSAPCPAALHPLQGLAALPAVRRPVWLTGYGAIGTLHTRGIPSLFGAVVFFGLMWQFARAHSRMWRDFTRYTTQPRTTAVATKFPESIVITRRGRTGPLIMGNALYRLYA